MKPSNDTVSLVPFFFKALKIFQTMTKIPNKLQGTDGIRGRITSDNDLNGLTALDYFGVSGKLTPSFFEHYAYAYATLLMETKTANKDDSIVVGWDPRDREGVFNESAVSGIRKAGLNVIQVGILPTPAIPLYMISTQAVGSMVLTASHNPSDQNGIKLFHGHTALKFLPPDDEMLTAVIKKQRAFDLSRISLEGKLEDHSQEARDMFVSFSIDPENSWIKETGFFETILVVDASKGAVSSVVEEIFSRFTFKELIVTNLEGNINECCGVADIEGQEIIAEADVIEPGSRFNNYETLQTIFKKSKTESEIQSGRIKLTGLVFDGDGDRCYRLDYHPEKNEILVSSGDLLGIHQAVYLKKRLMPENAWFVNTVESDLNTAITARDSGYNAILTGVGDKWILLRAVLDMIKSQIDSASSNSKTILEKLLKIEQNPDVSGFEISQLWRKVLMSEDLKKPATEFQFQIGIEESGHCITRGFLKVETETIPCFAGNGIKSGLNSLAAVEISYMEKKNDDWFKNISEPFPAGVKDTYYVYYVDKSRILSGSDFREKFSGLMEETVSKWFSSEYQFEFVEFPEEKPMLYFSILKNDRQCGAVFVRNSGTEDKAALYLRGEKTIQTQLRQFGNVLHCNLLKGLKNMENEFARFEVGLLSAIKSGKTPESFMEKNKTLPVERILKEIELKEGLLKREEGKIQLSEKGKLFLDDL